MTARFRWAEWCVRTLLEESRLVEDLRPRGPRKGSVPRGRKWNHAEDHRCGRRRDCAPLGNARSGARVTPQERIHERLDVTFRDAAGEAVGHLGLSDVTTSHSAVEGYLQGPDGYVFYCEPTLLAEADVVQIAADAKSAVADIADVIPMLSCPEVEFARRWPARLPLAGVRFRRSPRGGDPAHPEVDRRRAAGQRCSD
jgi:hypothetical protein